MNVGETKRVVISKGNENRRKQGQLMEQVVYKTYLGKDKYTSRTAHEPVKK